MALLLVAAAATSFSGTSDSNLARGTGCFAAARLLVGGEVIQRNDVKPAPCAGTTIIRLLRFDRTMLQAVARADIAPETYLGRLWLPEAPAVRIGDAVVVRVRIGQVEIHREVRALQNGRAGQSFFVIDDYGQIFAAPPMSVAAEEE
ncbi:MAG: flagella basal body P-ring formation protein FlgA [Pseudomonadota bacterium]